MNDPIFIEVDKELELAVIIANDKMKTASHLSSVQAIDYAFDLIEKSATIQKLRREHATNLESNKPYVTTLNPDYRRKKR